MPTNAVGSTRVLVVADISRGGGLGHLSRAEGITGALAHREFPVKVCAIRSLDAAVTAYVAAAAAVHDLVVIDARPPMRAALLAVAAGRPRLAVMDDTGDEPIAADMVVNPGLAAPDYRARGLVPPACQVLIGPRWMPLRRAFTSPPSPRVAGSVQRILISLGATPDQQGLNRVVTEVRAALPDAQISVCALSAEPPPEPVDLLLGLPSLRDRMQAADVGVVSGGVTLLEALAVGLPVVAVPMAPDQSANVRSAAARGLALTASPDTVSGALRALAANAELRRAIATRGPRVVDGHGARRLAAALRALLVPPAA